jgi:hypothetical protein
MKYLLIWLSIFCVLGEDNPAQETQSASCVLKGKVSSLIDGAPIYGANVDLNSGKLGTVTDSSGLFSISGLNKGTYHLRVSFIGYLPFESTISFDSLQMVDLNITLVDQCDEINAEAAYKDIAKGKPKIILSGGIAPIANSEADFKFERRYGIKYDDLGCVAPADSCIAEYNKVIFAYLDKRFGRKWRSEVRKDVKIPK